MEAEILKWILNQGGGYVLVAGLFYFYRRDVKANIRDQREQKETLLQALIANTEVKTELTDAVNGLSEVVRFCEMRRVNETIEHGITPLRKLP